MATTDDSLLHWIIEASLRFFEGVFRDGPMDVPADIAVNMVLFQVLELGITSGKCLLLLKILEL